MNTENNTNHRDSLAREKSLNPNKSFLVQAPAGSGKTELLIQRYLSLLSSTTKEPEEIVAITFTKKAAGEMRERILAAIEKAQASSSIPVGFQHEQVTLELAKKVLAKDKQREWNLIKNPNRLRIFTIDSLAAQICRQTPILSGSGAITNIQEDCQSFYREAVIELISQLDLRNSQKLSKENDLITNNEALAQLLLHLDNHIPKTIQLLANLLGKREQWLPYLIGNLQSEAHLRNYFKSNLEDLINEQLEKLYQTIPNHLIPEWLDLANCAANYFKLTETPHPLVDCLPLISLPLPQKNSLEKWKALASVLLTMKGEWRKKVDKREGFPADFKEFGKPLCKQNQKRMMQLLEDVAEYEDFRLLLAELSTLPSSFYSQNQWEIILCLCQILPVLSAELRLIFHKYQVIDFNEITIAALEALGSEEEPTDLGLYLDYQIRHLLIDEFQDTSVIQFRLIERLLSGWNDDTRTLFLVGDPMQSIYRFRNAEVSLFLQVQQKGIAGINLELLKLERNFRSQQAIINWINHSFAKIFPSESNIIKGAVKYTSVFPTKMQQEHHYGVYYYPFIANKPKSQHNYESGKIIEIIKSYHRLDHGSSIAILVRSRSHLANIITTLSNEHIDFEATALEPLENYSEIQDLVSLTRAFLHRADRLAWLSFLRGPICGLLLADLLIIADASFSTTIWQVLQKKEYHQLSEDGKARLMRVVPVIEKGFFTQGRMPFSIWLETIWINLGGPATIETKTSLENVKTYFKLVDQLSENNPIFNIEHLEHKLKKLYAEPYKKTLDLNSCQKTEDLKYAKPLPIQIMTIHKSKGLEFDHVIIPGLNQSPRSEEKSLLLWLERMNHSDIKQFILAPLASSEDDEDPIYNYLKYLEKKKLDNESARLLYVAATRAKKSLHFLATLLTTDEGKEFAPKASNNSFLEMLWPIFQKESVSLTSSEFLSLTKNQTKPMISNFKRLSANWQPPFVQELTAATTNLTLTNTLSKLKEFSQETYIKRQLGNIVHQAFQWLATYGIEQWEKERSRFQKIWHQNLFANGVTEINITHVLKTINLALENSFECAKGQWLLRQHDKDSQEYSLTASLKGEIKHIIIDRTFIENGIRWIIDYKTSMPHEDELLEIFLANEKKLYLPQLELYATILRLKEDLPIRLALYFPLCKGWCEWDFDSNSCLELFSASDAPLGLC